MHDSFLSVCVYDVYCCFYIFILLLKGDSHSSQIQKQVLIIFIELVLPFFRGVSIELVRSPPGLCS